MGGVTTSAFFSDATRAIVQLRTETQSLLRAIGLIDRKATELASELRVSVNLAWKLTRLVDAGDALQALEFVPGAEAYALFVRAASKRGAPAKAIERAQRAVREVEAMITTHAGDRETLEILSSSVSIGASDKTMLAQRKAAFVANSAILGLQAQVSYRILYYAPMPDGAHIRSAMIRSTIGLRGFRGSAKWLASISGAQTTSGKPIDVSHNLPLDPSVKPGDPPIIACFSSSPIPICERQREDNGHVLDLVSFPEVGNQGMLTCTLGEVQTVLDARYRIPDDEFLAFALPVNTPCAIAIIEVFAHQDLFDGRPPEMEVYSRLFNSRFPARRELAVLPITAPVERVGNGLRSGITSEVPNATEMALYGFERLGWNPDQFRRYRVKIEYPPIASDILVYWPLPERPENKPR